jgi:hypothetical protein
MLPIRSLFSTALATASMALGQVPLVPNVPMPQVLKNYQPVTAERLKNPEPENWLMIRRTYDGWATARSIKSPRPTSNA